MRLCDPPNIVSQHPASPPTQSPCETASVLRRMTMGLLFRDQTGSSAVSVGGIEGALAGDDVPPALRMFGRSLGNRPSTVARTPAPKEGRWGGVGQVYDGMTDVSSPPPTGTVERCLPAVLTASRTGKTPGRINRCRLCWQSSWVMELASQGSKRKEYGGRWLWSRDLNTLVFGSRRRCTLASQVFVAGVCDGRSVGTKMTIGSRRFCAWRVQMMP